MRIAHLVSLGSMGIGLHLVACGGDDESTASTESSGGDAAIGDARGATTGGRSGDSGPGGSPGSVDGGASGGAAGAGGAAGSDADAGGSVDSGASGGTSGSGGADGGGDAEATGGTGGSGDDSGTRSDSGAGGEAGADAGGADGGGDSAAGGADSSLGNDPIPQDDSFDAVQGELATFDVLANDGDPDGDPLTLVSVQGALHGSTTINAGAIDYAPSAVFAGQDTFTYTVADGNGGQATATVTVTVDARPNAVDDQATTLLDQAVVVDVLGNDSDPDLDSLTVVDVEVPAMGTVLTDGSTITFTPNTGFVGTASFTYTINDGRGATDLATVTVAVTHAPTPVADVAQTVMGVPVLIDVLSNDTEPDGEALSIAAVTQGTGGTVAIQSGMVEFSPENGFFGTAMFTYDAADVHGATATASVTVDVSPFPEGIVASSGTYHTCVVPRDDSLECWGWNISGQLGINGNVSQSTPQTVGAATDWRLVEGGDRQTCGIRGDGVLYCWGSGSDGQLGLGRPSSSQVPTQVGSELWADVSTGDRHTCAIRMDQTLWCVAWNLDGQVGVGSSSLWVDNLTQVGSGQDWFVVSSGDAHTCGLKNGGELWCWGSNTNDQLGDPSITRDATTPRRIGTATDWSTVEAGQRHNCGLRQGALYCWGSGAGTGTGGTGSVETPTLVDAGPDWTAVTVGAAHTCGIASGELFCWGSNLYGQLGDGTTTDALAPLRIGTDSDWVGVTAAAESTCAWKADDSFYCWGRKLYGGLGDGDTPVALSPVQVGTDTDWDFTANAQDVFGRGFTCAVKTDDSLHCWGFNSNGQLGTGDRMPRQFPVPIGSATSWDAFGLGYDHSCALRTDQSRWCWGSNWLGMFGSGNTSDSLVPTQVDLDSWLSTDGGRYHSCGVMNDGSMWCWGRNNNEQLGVDTATLTQSNSPRQVGTDTDWTMTSNGEWRSCGLKSGELWCWGATFGPDPQQVGTDTDWASFEHGATQLCGVKTNNTLWCGDIPNAPTQLGSDTNWLQVATNDSDHACARKSTGALYCWGANDLGQLGLGDTTERNLPTQVGTDTDWDHVSVGEAFTCAVKSDDTLWCWGSNDSGQLGIGGAWQSTAVQVGL